MWCLRRNRSKKELYKAMVDNLVLAEESNQALLAEVKRLKEERSDLVKAQQEETQRLEEQVTKLQTEKSSLEKDCSDSTNFIQHQLDSTLQEKTGLQLSLEQTNAELQDLKEAHARSVEINKEVTDLKEKNQALSTELQSVQQTLRTLEGHSEEDRQQKNSIIKDAEHHIEELETKMQDQEMHLRKDIEEGMMKRKAQEAETQKLTEQVTQLQTEKSALEKNILDSTALVQHKLDTTLQEKNGLQLSLQQTTAELQAAKDEVKDLKEACAKYLEMNKEVTNVATILNKEKQDLSAELQSVKQTLRRSEEDGQRKDSIIKDAEHYIEELKTKMQDQEMHLRKEMEEELNKCKESKAVAVKSLRKALDENLRLHYDLKNPSKQQIQDPQEDHAPHYPQNKWRRSRQKTHVYRPNQPPLVTVPKH